MAFKATQTNKTGGWDQIELDIHTNEELCCTAVYKLGNKLWSDSFRGTWLILWHHLIKDSGSSNHVWWCRELATRGTWMMKMSRGLLVYVVAYFHRLFWYKLLWQQVDVSCYSYSIFKSFSTVECSALYRLLFFRTCLSFPRDHLSICLPSCLCLCCWCISHLCYYSAPIW